MYQNSKESPWRSVYIFDCQKIDISAEMRSKNRPLRQVFIWRGVIIELFIKVRDQVKMDTPGNGFSIGGT